MSLPLSQPCLLWGWPGTAFHGVERWNPSVRVAFWATPSSRLTGGHSEISLNALFPFYHKSLVLQLKTKFKLYLTWHFIINIYCETSGNNWYKKHQKFDDRCDWLKIRIHHKTVTRIYTRIYSNIVNRYRIVILTRRLATVGAESTSISMKVNFTRIIGIQSRSYIPLCRAELFARQGDKTQEESVMANSYDRRIRTKVYGMSYERFGYLHNVGRRRNSTAGGNDVLPYSRGHFQEARGRRSQEKSLPARWAGNSSQSPVYMSIHPPSQDRHKYRRLVFIPRERSSRSRPWKRWNYL